MISSDKHFNLFGIFLVSGNYRQEDINNYGLTVINNVFYDDYYGCIIGVDLSNIRDAYNYVDFRFKCAYAIKKAINDGVIDVFNKNDLLEYMQEFFN